MTRSAKWVVVEHTPGYLSESDPIECGSYREACTAGAELVRELRDTGYHCYGSGRAGSWYCEMDRDDLGRAVEIMEMDYEAG
jgi:hypothetical protein